MCVCVCTCGQSCVWLPFVYLCMHVYCILCAFFMKIPLKHGDSMITFDISFAFITYMVHLKHLTTLKVDNIIPVCLQTGLTKKILVTRAWCARWIIFKALTFYGMCWISYCFFHTLSSCNCNVGFSDLCHLKVLCMFYFKNYVSFRFFHVII